jgi:hypothetical protein
MLPRRDYRFSVLGLMLTTTACCVVLGTYSLFDIYGATVAVAVIGCLMYSVGLRQRKFWMSFVGFYLGLPAVLFAIVLFWSTFRGNGPHLYK